MTRADLLLENAEISWLEPGAPYSSRFEDVYFSRDGGLEETRHVFLQGNRLAQRWADAAGVEPVLFTVAELGFGTGLNFLCCWQLWEQTAPRNLRLHFISCEKYPLEREALRQALSAWPELESHAHALLAAYPDHTEGYHRLLMPESDNRPGVTLDLYYGDAAGMLAQQIPEPMQIHPGDDMPAPPWPGPYQAKIDAWFLDGFAPRVNPDMWSTTLLAVVAALSRPGTTLSTYSVARQVVDSLEACGFRTQKQSGFGRKRQMLAAEFAASHINVAREAQKAQYQRSSAPSHTDHDVLVIGAGLAGCSTAWQLARRGLRVAVLDEADTVAHGASGNPQAVLQCRMNRTVSPEWQFNLQSFLFASRYYDFMSLTQAFDWHKCGVLTLESAYGNTRKKTTGGSYTHYASKVLQRLDAREASVLAGISIQEAGSFLPDGGWLNPASLCHSYLQHPLINCSLGAQVHTIEREQDIWHLYDIDGQRLGSAPTVVIANSYSARHLEQAASIPIMPLRGQVSFIPASPASQRMRCVICASSYIAPAHEGQHSVGASYVKGSTSRSLEPTEHQDNIAGIGAYAGELGLHVEAQLAGRAAVRGGTLDFMPVVGQLPDPGAWRGVHGGAQHFTANSSPVGSGLYPGLFINAGHGSHGCATTPLVAEYLASVICREPLPLQRDVAAVVDPARFIRRELKRLAAMSG